MELQMFHLFGPLSIRFVHQSPNNQGNRISELRKYNGQLLIAYGWRVYVSEENLADLGLPNVGALTNHPSRNEENINYQHSLDLSICHDWKPAIAAPQVVAGRTISARLAAPTAGIPVLNQFYKYGEINEEGYKT